MASKVAFVLGGANTLFADLEAAFQLGLRPDTTIMTNDTARDWKTDVDHWVTLHTEKMVGWMAIREEQGLPEAKHYWTSNTKTVPREHKAMYNYVTSWDGSSGLLGVTVALELGYSKIILCGIPLDKEAAHYFDDAPWPDAPRYRSAWTKRLSEMQGRVKSMGGYTARLLGQPDEDWLYG